MAKENRWPNVRLKNICSESGVYGANIPAEVYIDSGIRFIRTTDITEKGELRENGVYVSKHLVVDYLLQDGDILVSRSGTVGRTFLYESVKHGPCSYAGYLVKFQANKQATPKFVHYYAKSSIFQSMVQEAAISSTIENVNAAKYANFPIPLPPPDEQTAIVRFLDHADEQIPRYIAGKERLIALLEEERRALVHQAVTRGLDPSVRLKPSGVDWLGDVPEHWTIRTLGQIADSFRTGPFGSMLHQSDYIEGGIPVINPIHIRGGVIVEDPSCSVSDPVAVRLSDYRLAKHDLVFSRRGELGRCSLVRDRETNWLCGTGSIRVRITYDGINPEFVIQALQVQWVGEYLSHVSVGATMNNLNTGILKSIPILMPPLQEQGNILERITRQTSAIDVAMTSTRQMIGLLQEYRTRLIADVVTGQLDVREAAAQLPAAP